MILTGRCHKRTHNGVIVTENSLSEDPVQGDDEMNSNESRRQHKPQLSLS